MSKTDFYRQCTLRRGNSTTVAYIPERFTAIGQVVKIRNDDGQWSNGWVVVDAGEKIPSQWVEDNQMAYTRNRKASDI